MWTAVSLATFFILTLAAVIALQAIFFRMKETEFTKKVVERLPAELIALQDEQTAQLARYRWIDKEAGVAGIPIERAMELVVEEESAGAGER